MNSNVSSKATLLVLKGKAQGTQALNLNSCLEGVNGREMEKAKPFNLVQSDTGEQAAMWWGGELYRE